MTYDDQVRMARRVLALPAVQRELAQDRLSVLLDEAQDTDAHQFDLLLQVAGLRPELNQGEDQTLCIVGDFQQAIWAPRSDLRVYREVHTEILEKIERPGCQPASRSPFAATARSSISSIASSARCSTPRKARPPSCSSAPATTPDPARSRAGYVPRDNHARKENSHRGLRGERGPLHRP